MTPDEIEAKRKRLGLSIRAAAKLADISEGRWRQIVRGSMRVGGVEVPVNPKESTLAAMARAVSGKTAEPGTTIEGYTDDELLAEVRRRMMREGGSHAEQTPSEKTTGGVGAAAGVFLPARDVDDEAVPMREVVKGRRQPRR